VRKETAGDCDGPTVTRIMRTLEAIWKIHMDAALGARSSYRGSCAQDFRAQHSRSRSTTLALRRQIPTCSSDITRRPATTRWRRRGPNCDTTPTPADITTQIRTIVNRHRIRPQRRKHHRPLTRRTLPINRTMGLNIPGNQRHWKARRVASHRGRTEMAGSAIRLEVSQRHKSCWRADHRSAPRDGCAD